MTGAHHGRSRLSPELLRSRREVKAELHRERGQLDLRQKVRVVLELQRMYLLLLQRRRPLGHWGRPWQVEP